MNYTRLRATDCRLIPNLRQPRLIDSNGRSYDNPRFQLLPHPLQFSLMVILLNGEKHTLSDGATAATLVEALGLGEKRIAMEVNREIVPRSQYANHPLHEGDQVEVVHAIGGGSQ